LAELLAEIKSQHHFVFHDENGLTCCLLIAERHLLDNCLPSTFLAEMPNTSLLFHQEQGLTNVVNPRFALETAVRAIATSYRCKPPIDRLAVFAPGE
jgi:hypothetical protein